MRPKAIVAWSSGKDSAVALHEVVARGDVEVVGILTTLTAAFERVSMHGVREALLEAQAVALGLPCRKVLIPSPCPNEVYEAEMEHALRASKADGVSQVVFGDLFLRDVRDYREAGLAEVGMAGSFPLWGKDTSVLARDMVDAGLSATLTCVDPRQLDGSFAGRRFDHALLDELPDGVDPCGENGEFHTVVTAGPMFRQPIAVRTGPVVERGGFVFADVLLDH